MVISMTPDVQAVRPVRCFPPGMGAGPGVPKTAAETWIPRSSKRSMNRGRMPVATGAVRGSGPGGPPRPSSRKRRRPGG